MATEKPRAAQATAPIRQQAVSAFESELIDLDASVESTNFLIYGDPGCGKTRLAATLPGRLLFLAGEPGFISAARGGAQGRVSVIPDTARMLAALDWLEGGHWKDFDWVIPDGISTMGQKFLLGYAAEAFDANPAKRAHRNLPDKPDYFNTQNFMKSMVSRLVDLPTNVLFTAHAHHTEQPDGELRVYPGIQGKNGEVSDYISGLMHVVGYMSKRVPKTGANKGKEVRRVFWQTVIDEENNTRYIAKDQFDALGRYGDDLTMEQVIKACGIGMPAAATVRPTRRRRAAA
jgi:Cdc6-like AAA superfamily ATPase